MKTIKSLLAALLLFLSSLSVLAQSAEAKPTIIFVHGIWADGSSWRTQITELQAKGYPVTSVQNPITSLADDVAATKRAITNAKGRVILVGHSWGGFVISQAGNDPKVAGLVYVAAFAPDQNETIKSLSAKGPAVKLADYFRPQGGFIYLSHLGIKTVFAQDLTPAQQNVIFATQTPGAETVFTDKSGPPAWKTKPSWYIVAKNDRAISPDLERFMAKRIKASTTEIGASHVVMMSHPTEVLKVILQAAEKSGK